MSAGTHIQWTNATWNPTTGCTRVSAGCDNCYAVKQSHRMEAMGHKKYAGLTVLNPRGERHFNGVVRCVEEDLMIPTRWRKPRMIFVNSMSDLFHRDVPFEFIDRVFAVMWACRRHTFQILTKRPERMAEYMAGMSTRHHAGPDRENTLGPDPDRWDAARRPLWLASKGREKERIGVMGAHPTWPLPNVWLGTSVEDQATADQRLPHLLRCPAAIRFVSYEPALGPVNFHEFLLGFSAGNPARCICGHGHGFTRCPNYGKVDKECPHCDCRQFQKALGDGLHQIIVGGESGPGARRCNVAWIRSVRDQCRAAGVACFVKQFGRHAITTRQEDLPDWYVRKASEDNPICLRIRDHKGGDMAEWPEDLRVREWPKST